VLTVIHGEGGSVVTSLAIKRAQFRSTDLLDGIGDGVTYTGRIRHIGHRVGHFAAADLMSGSREPVIKAARIAGIVEIDMFGRNPDLLGLAILGTGGTGGQNGKRQGGCDEDRTGHDEFLFCDLSS
jgi:hypothetical protein